MTAPTAPPVPGVVTADGIGEKRPSINRMGVGRTVAIKPIRVEQVTKQDKQAPGGVKVVRRVIADVVVLDGSPIMFGGNLNSGAPDDMQQAVPCVIPQLWIDEVVVGNQIERYAGSGSYVVGKIKQLPLRPGDTGRPSWAIEDCTPVDNALFLQWWNATSGGMNFTNPAPVSIRPTTGLAGGVVAAATAAPAAAGLALAPAGWDLPTWLALPEPHKQQITAAIAQGRAVPQEALGYPPAQPVAAALPPLDLSGIGIVPQAAAAPVPAAAQAAPAFDFAAFQAAKLAAATPAPAAPVDVPPANSGIDQGTWNTLDEPTKAEIRTACGVGTTNPPGFA